MSNDNSNKKQLSLTPIPPTMKQASKMRKSSLVLQPKFEVKLGTSPMVPSKVMIPPSAIGAGGASPKVSSTNGGNGVPPRVPSTIDGNSTPSRVPSTSGGVPSQLNIPKMPRLPNKPNIPPMPTASDIKGAYNQISSKAASSFSLENLKTLPTKFIDGLIALGDTIKARDLGPFVTINLAAGCFVIGFNLAKKYSN